MFHHVIFLSLLLFFLPTNFSLASFTANSESSREAIVNSARAKKFYKHDLAIKRFALGGSYDSDQNSSQYQGYGRYFFQSYRFIHEINLLQQTQFNDQGSGDKKTYKTKTSELYDASISSKARIAETRNYGAFYHRTVYDKLSSYYYDLETALGLGRMFFDDKFEFDLSVGYHQSKSYNNNFNLIPSVRINIPITERLTLNHRGYWFVDHQSTDSDLRFSLIYRLSPKTSFEIRHVFEKRTYRNANSGGNVNQVRNFATLGLVFDLN